MTVRDKTLKKRSFSIAGHRTSVALEPEFWTALHTPTITLPTHRGPNGLPIGIQLIGRLYEDETLLAAARWVSHHLGSA